MTGTPGNDTLNGLAGADILNGGPGADTLVGGDGSDTYYVDNALDIVSETNAVAGTGGTDLVYSYLTDYTLTTNVENGRILATGAANLSGNILNNILYASSVDNILDGNTGIDTVSYQYGATTGVTASLAINIAQVTGGSGSDTLLNLENLIGSNYDDHLTGNSSNNVLSGGGGIGDDSLEGGAGNDVLNGGAGADTMIGGDGSDLYYVDNAFDIVTETNAVASTGGSDTVYSYLAGYTLGNNVEKGRILTTGAADLTGNALNNILYGGSGNNALSGDAGNDTLIGGVGLDTLTGGSDNDFFDFNALSELGLGLTRDVITDFTSGQDKIDLSTIDADAGLAGNQAFALVTNFTATGQISYSGGIIAFNTDANIATAEYEIQLTGVVPALLTAADFVL